MASKRSAASHNPFDSDDDESVYSNPFDDHGDTSTRGSGAAKLSQHHRPTAPKLPPQHDLTNPFDDDDDAANPFNDHASTKMPAGKSSLSDDYPKPKSTISWDGQHIEGEGQGADKPARHQFRERVTASGDAVLKKAHRLKDAGANQASKLVDGGANQMQRLKESSHNAFKSSSNDNKDVKLTKQKPEARNELLGNEWGQASGTNAGVARTRYEDSQFRSQDLEYRSVQELEGYAVQKSEETTASLLSSLKVAEEIRGDASQTLLSLHEQGEQINRTHEVALDIDQNLSSSEKLLGTLGGMFSKTWKPKKGRPVMGPAAVRNDSFKRRANHLEQRTALGLNSRNSKGHVNHTSPSNELQTTHVKLQEERTKQDDTLSDLSNVLDELKGMSIDMGLEISSQAESLDNLQDDVTSLNERVKGANMRGRRLLGKCQGHLMSSC